MAERVLDATQQPVVLRLDRCNLSCAQHNGPLDDGVRVVHDEEQPHVLPPSDSGLKFSCSGDSSDTQNDASPTASCATTSSCSSVPPTRCSSTRRTRPCRTRRVAAAPDRQLGGFVKARGAKRRSRP
jgi:hypothetical protein